MEDKKKVAPSSSDAFDVGSTVDLDLDTSESKPTDDAEDQLGLF